jgi:hypothetical protein
MSEYKRIGSVGSTSYYLKKFFTIQNETINILYTLNTKNGTTTAFQFNSAEQIKLSIQSAVSRNGYEFIIGIMVSLFLVGERTYKARQLLKEFRDPILAGVEQAEKEIVKLIYIYAKKHHKFRNRTGNLERSITQTAQDIIKVYIDEGRAPYAKEIVNRDPFLDEAVRLNIPKIKAILEREIDTALERNEHKIRYMATEVAKESAITLIEGYAVKALIQNGWKRK